MAIFVVATVAISATISVSACGAKTELAADAAGGGDGADGSIRPDRPDASAGGGGIDAGSPVGRCDPLSSPTQCDTRDGLEVYCIAAGGTIFVSSQVRYGPGFPLMAMGVGTATAVDGFDLGYITEAYPFTCVPTGCAGAVGVGNSENTGGKICEISFDIGNGAETTSSAYYAITAGARAATGDYLFGFAATSGSTVTGPRFYLRIGAGPL